MQVLLFTRPDERSVDAAVKAGPDILVVDPSGCRIVRDRTPRDAVAPRLWVVIAPLDQGRAEAEIAAALEARPDALCLAGAIGRRDVERLGAKLAVAEAEHSLPDGSTRIVAVIDRAAAITPLSTIEGGGRLAGLVLDLGGLRADLGCGPDAAALALALGASVLAARTADIPAIFLLNDADEGTTPDRLAAARSEGFAAVLVDRPDAVAAIRAALRPGSDA